jgi:hypothetical protein
MSDGAAMNNDFDVAHGQNEGSIADDIAPPFCISENRPAPRYEAMYSA